MKHETMCLDFLTCTCEAIRAGRQEKALRPARSMMSGVIKSKCKNCGEEWRNDHRDKIICPSCLNVEPKEAA